jgi:hypothetical protein
VRVNVLIQLAKGCRFGPTFLSGVQLENFLRVERHCVQSAIVESVLTIALSM